MNARIALLSISIIVSVWLMLAGCASKQETIVVVVEKTRMYHFEVCPRVNMAQTKQMTIQEAKALHYRRCEDCIPPPPPDGVEN